MSKIALFAFAAMALYAGWAFFAKLATRTLPAEQAVIYTYVAGLTAATGYLLWQDGPVVISTRGIGLALAGGLLLGLGTITYYIALSQGSVAVATSISGLYLLGTTLLAVVFLDEPLGQTKIVGIALAVGAVVLLAQ
ncbi:EamA family transporter [Halegenticoccus tardaugens]|uniref:EamA family transporter n=1 Tax=Halegenticoccus tardaugens TaxID=2071624 RepID=UPI00100C0E87|nr:EamA family transporter [Halegenticoccus tardaugens]